MWIDCAPNLTVRATQPGNYLRIAQNTLGDVLEAWQDPDGFLRYRVNFRTVFVHGMTGGQNVALPVADGERWTLYVQRSKWTYDALCVNRAGEVVPSLSAVGLRIPLPDGTSQGFTGYWGGAVRWLDDYRCLHADGRIDADPVGRILMVPNVAPDGTVIGQYPYDDAPGIYLWRPAEPLTLRRVFVGHGYEPHIAIDSDGRYRCVARPGQERILSPLEVAVLPAVPAPVTGPPTQTPPPVNDPPKEPPVSLRYLSVAERATVAAYAAKFGLPPFNDADYESVKPAAREWTRRLAEQMKFSHGATWCHKRADPGRPPSTDVIASQEGGAFIGWDVIVNQGGSNQRLHLDGPAIDLVGQTPIPVEPINHLGVEPPPVDPPTDPPTDPPADADVLARLTHIDAGIAQITGILSRVFK